MTPLSKLDMLLNAGVRIQAPATVAIDEDVRPERIAPGVVIHPGCRIRGADTSIGPGCVIGAEAPATVENCQLAEKVSLAGGSFSGATFLSGASFGSCAHVRPDTLLEESASCAHSVGLKQTLLMPFVTLGSLINFCDCLMSGGTSRKNHSEVGSSYIHFNYTPHQDKATASLFGDVPRGVRLDQPPIFLGGQGGAVGPIRLAHGTVVAAGSIVRRDQTDPGYLLFGALAQSCAARPYQPGIHGTIRRIAANNLLFIGNLIALREWYRAVRIRFLGANPFHEAAHTGALLRLDGMIGERIRRLDEVVERIANSPDKAARQLCETWPSRKDRIISALPADNADRDAVLAAMPGPYTPGDYVATIQSLTPGAREHATAWMSAMIEHSVGTIG
jgi:UDP-N-acetylglucosamine/UDP-N-acetylgalactosamine diphosphorylase